jgi:hypothetical protein
MTDNKYYGERCGELFEILTKELQSLIKGDKINIGPSSFQLLHKLSSFDDGDEGETMIEFVRINPHAECNITIYVFHDKTDCIEAFYADTIHGWFNFPINLPCVQQSPGVLFQKWMEIAILDESLEERQAKFQTCAQGIMNLSDFTARQLCTIRRGGSIVNPDRAIDPVLQGLYGDVFRDLDLTEMIHREGIGPDYKRYGQDRIQN